MRQANKLYQNHPDPLLIHYHLKNKIMKIVILIFVFLLGVGASIKKSAKDMKQLSARQELSMYKHQPNLLPEVEITAPSV